MQRKIIVYLVRHAESESNVSLGTGASKDVDDTFSNGLTQLGKEQAALLGGHLAGVKFHRVYSSDYLRAIETTKIVLEKSCGVGGQQPEIRITKYLRDIDFGDLTHATYTEKTEHYLSSNKPIQEWALPNGESFSGTGLRMLNTVEKICANILDESKAIINDEVFTILITSHSISIAAFLDYLSNGNGNLHPHQIRNWDPKKDLKIIKNCCYYKLQVSRVAGESGNKVGTKSLKVEALEKYVSRHLIDDNGNCDDGKNVGGKGAYYEKGEQLKNFLKSSSRGKEVLNCCQQ